MLFNLAALICETCTPLDLPWTMTLLFDVMVFPSILVVFGVLCLSGEVGNGTLDGYDKQRKIMAFVLLLVVGYVSHLCSMRCQMLISSGCSTYFHLHCTAWLLQSEIVQRIKEPTDARRSPLDHCTIRFGRRAFAVPIKSTAQLQCRGFRPWLRTFCRCTRRATHIDHLQHTNPQTKILRSRCSWVAEVKIMMEGCRSKHCCTCYLVLFKKIFSVAIFSTHWKALFQTVWYLLSETDRRCELMWNITSIERLEDESSSEDPDGHLPHSASPHMPSLVGKRAARLASKQH